MIAFGCAITSGETYRRFAEPGIRLAAEPDSEVMAYASTGSIFHSYNILLEKAARLEGLEALVLVHQDAEIVDPDFCAKVRWALADPEVGLVGCVGAIGVRSIAWWEGSITWASFTHRYQELGGGEFPAFAWKDEVLPPYARTGEVETIDGFVMAISPATVRETRFDESLGKLHGYDFDFSLQVREAGRKVVTADFQVIHHHSLDLISDVETWVEAHMRVAEKWEDRLLYSDNGGVDWKARARRAEAEAAAARAQAVAAGLQADAREIELQGYLDEMKRSASWRMTRPLRAAKRLIGRRRD
jgi:Glycosyltransferase like family